MLDAKKPTVKKSEPEKKVEPKVDKPPIIKHMPGALRRDLERS